MAYFRNNAINLFNIHYAIFSVAIAPGAGCANDTPCWNGAPAQAIATNAMIAVFRMLIIFLPPDGSAPNVAAPVGLSCQIDVTEALTTH